MSAERLRRIVLLECGYAHLIPDDAPLPKIGDMAMCGKHHYEHRVTWTVSGDALAEVAAETECEGRCEC